jgi:hypothetical protein
MTTYYIAAATILFMTAICFVAAWIYGYRARRDHTAPDYEDRYGLEGMRLRASREANLNMRENFLRGGWGLVIVAGVYMIYLAIWGPFR